VSISIPSRARPRSGDGLGWGPLRPERIAALFPTLHLDAIQADVNDDRSVAAAVAGVEGVVNAVSLYAESGSQTFHSVHVEAATRVARLARESGVGRVAFVTLNRAISTCVVRLAGGSLHVAEGGAWSKLANSRPSFAPTWSDTADSPARTRIARYRAIEGSGTT